MLLEQLGRLRLVCRLEHAMPARLQGQAQHLAQRVTVFDEQNLG